MKLLIKISKLICIIFIATVTGCDSKNSGEYSSNRITETPAAKYEIDQKNKGKFDQVAFYIKSTKNVLEAENEKKRKRIEYWATQGYDFSGTNFTPELMDKLADSLKNETGPSLFKRKGHINHRQDQAEEKKELSADIYTEHLRNDSVRKSNGATGSLPSGYIESHYRCGTYVEGYFRRDGTYVSPHYRSGGRVSGSYR
jgi:hypothetical protein